MEVSRGKWSAISAVLVSATALFAAAPASADAPDDTFVNALANYGIDVSDRDSAIAHAHAVCAGFDRGQDSSFLALKLTHDPSFDLSLKQAGFFIGASVAIYCPQHRDSIDPSLVWLLPFPPMM
ncbi:hypothetical protein A5683_16580 [Mycobacterium mantenii]|uniref:DUF732 domain-containing protein n=1 Tax=Mycobacterium mantenii TaxID=560555 RepID=A0A1A2TRB2_MYCNT|nr:hypothetical protein A5688_05795 [Mycobacterium mantenii]OBH78904.1 hypothetical protein A5683_16580 [Mycobacterium mantenii]